MGILKNLFSSSIRADVLSLLLNSPGEQFYVREIARLLRKNPSGVKRELDNLENMGIVFSERVANLKYFQANEESELYSELKNLITKSLGLPGALKAMFRASGATAAFIYGPYAEGEDSDTVDLYVIGAEEPIDKKLRTLGRKFGYTLKALQIDDEAFQRKRKKRDVALNRVLSGKRIKLIGRV